MSANSQQLVSRLFKAASKNAGVVDMTGARPSAGREGDPGSGTGAGSGQTGPGAKPPPPDSSTEFPGLGKSAPKPKSSTKPSYARVSSASRSLYDERQRLREELADRAQGSNNSVKPSHLQTRKHFATIDIYSMVDLATIERLAVIEKLCETMNLLSTVNSQSNKLSIRMQVALKELPSLVGIVEQLNQEFGKDVLFLQPATRGDRGRGKSRIVFSSETPTYEQLAEVIKLTDVNVIPVLTSEQWKDLVAANADKCIPSVLEIQAGGRNFPLDLETFEGVLANKTLLNFSIQSASGSYIRSYNQRFCSVNLQNANRTFTFVFENKKRFQPDREAALELANALQRHSLTSSNFLGVTLGTWVRPVAGLAAPSSVKFHFAVEKGTGFSELSSTMRQIYTVVAEELGQRGLECDFKDHRIIPVESYAHKMTVDAVKQQVQSMYNITIDWSTNKHKVCHMCGHLHNAVLCPLTVIVVEDESLIRRVNDEAIGAEEANIKALRTPADSFQTRFIDPLAPHNKLTGGCSFISESAVSVSVPDDREEPIDSILQQARHNFTKIRPPNVQVARVRPTKRPHVEQQDDENDDRDMADENDDRDMADDSQL